jgi:membrane-bound metal-dependent hydrolase YbcI (DUF457 family)
VTAVVAAIAAALVEPTIGVATDRHRGWTHNPLVNSVLTTTIAALVWVVTNGLAVHRRVAAVVVVATFFVGALIHLGLDGEIV